MLLGGWTALRQHDLKLLLAYGTVSQLGLLAAVFGGGSRDAALAGAAMLLAHALFKSTLFLVVGIIDISTGTRDLRELSGLRPAGAGAGGGRRAGRRVDGRAAAAGGVRRQGGRVRRVPRRRPAGGDLAVLAGLVIGSALTVAYTLRFLWGAFADKPGVAGAAARPIAPDWLVWPGDSRGRRPRRRRRREAARRAAWRAVRRPVPGGRRRVPPRGVARPDPAARPVRPGAGRPARALFAYWPARLVAAPRLPVDGGTVLRAGDRTGSTGRGRGHRRHPARLAAVLSRHHPAGAGRRPGRRCLLGAAPWPGHARAWDTSLQLVVRRPRSSSRRSLAVRALRRLTAMVLVGVTGYGDGGAVHPARRAGPGADPVPGRDLRRS